MYGERSNGEKIAWNLRDVLYWSPGVTLELVEKQVIIKAYKHFKNNKTATANALGIAIRTLDAKLEKYEYDNKREEEAQLQKNETNETSSSLENEEFPQQQLPENVLSPLAGFRVDPF